METGEGNTVCGENRSNKIDMKERFLSSGEGENRREKKNIINIYKFNRGDSQLVHVSKRWVIIAIIQPL